MRLAISRRLGSAGRAIYLFGCLLPLATHHVVGWPECDGSGSNCTAYGIHDMVLAPMMLCWTYAPLVYFV